MPDYLILLSTLGGLGVFGISGFVIGPILASLFLAVWQMFEADMLVWQPTAGREGRSPDDGQAPGAGALRPARPPEARDPPS